MKRAVYAAVLACLCAVPAWAATVDRIVAVVNADIITEAELSAITKAFIAELPPPVSEAQARQARQAMLRRLVEDRLVLQEARRLGLAVTTDEIDAKIAEVRGRFSSDEEFRDSLEASGVTLEQFRQRLKDQLLSRKVVDERVRARITISPQEVSQEMDAHPELRASGPRVKLRHILVRAGQDRTEAQAHALTEQLARQIRGGGAFTDLARQHSDDAHAAAGGDMGWVASGELLPELDAALAALAPGQVSDPIKTSLGYHLLLPEERKDAAELAPQDANNAVYRAIYERKLQLARFAPGVAWRVAVVCRGRGIYQLADHECIKRIGTVVIFNQLSQRHRVVSSDQGQHAIGLQA